MRLPLFAVLFVSACAAPDPFVATYNVTVTGTDMQTAPSTATNNVTGTGSLAVTTDKELMGYLLTFGQEGYLCRLRATKSTATPPELNITDGQSCAIGAATATTTGGKVTLDTSTMTIGTLTVSYSYSYTLVFNYAGTGTRTFTGPKL